MCVYVQLYICSTNCVGYGILTADGDLFVLVFTVFTTYQL